MDDNATCHRTLAGQDCLDSEGIQRLVWPARSPDLNIIENVWDALGRQVAGRNYPPTNKNTLIRALTEEWDKLPQQLLDNGVQNQDPQDINKEEFQVDRVRLQAFVAATDPGCKKELIREATNLRSDPGGESPCYATELVAAVAEWYRHRIVAGFVTNSSPVPLKTRRVGQRCTLNLSRLKRPPVGVVW
ncbi:transposable element Tcb1 transposase [Trichonephila clavipes]|nr:transposable element Tcb1 transposase [Trichonephila clavipes]